MKLDIWDTASSEELTRMIELHYRGTHVFLIVFSIDRVRSFRSVDDNFYRIKNLCGEDARIVLVGNKVDLEVERRVDFDDLAQKADELDCEFFETSALPERRDTIEALFDHIILSLDGLQQQQPYGIRLTNR